MQNSILDSYFSSAPSIQNALDIFKNTWSSKLPVNMHQYIAGAVPLFEDRRIVWANSEIGGFKNKTILELGPLEAGNTYMLEKYGAKSILAIEANSKAYLKCLIIKEIMNLKNSKFQCGNFVEYLKTCKEKFDCCLASGVLYHMVNPAELISLISNVSDTVCMWTHYYNEDLISKNQNLSDKSFSPTNQEYDGFKHTIFKQEYNDALNTDGFCGGLNDFSNWMTKFEILQCLEHFGFNNIKTEFEMTDHPHGPCIQILAKKE